MKRLVIAVDCDDVLVDTTERLTHEYNERFSTSAQVKNAFRLGLPEWGAERDIVLGRFCEIYMSQKFRAFAPRPDAREVIARLSRDHELHLVTARFVGLELVTLQMINEYFASCFKEINHVGDASKGELCRAFQSDVLIDDNAKHLKDAKNCGVGSTIWFGEYPWQEHDSDFVDYTARCKDWYEAEREIDRIANS